MDDRRTSSQQQQKQDRRLGADSSGDGRYNHNLERARWAPDVATIEQQALQQSASSLLHNGSQYQQEQGALGPHEQVSMMQEVSMQMRELESRYKEQMLKMAQIQDLQSVSSTSLLQRQGMPSTLPISTFPPALRPTDPNDLQAFARINAHDEHQLQLINGIYMQQLQQKRQANEAILRQRLHHDCLERVGRHPQSRLSHIPQPYEQDLSIAGTIRNMAGLPHSASIPGATALLKDSDSAAPLSMLADAASTASPTSTPSLLTQKLVSIAPREEAFHLAPSSVAGEGIAQIDTAPPLPASRRLSSPTQLQRTLQTYRTNPYQIGSEPRPTTVEDGSRKRQKYMTSGAQPVNSHQTSAASLPHAMASPFSASPAAIFPKKLHLMLKDLDHQNLTHIASWQPHGKCFRINNTEAFTNHIMQRYFNQSKFSSFNRQLNLYGFKRLYQNGPDKGCYYHPKFLRDDPEACLSIERTKVNGRGKRCKSNPEAEPKFYEDNNR